MVDQKSLETGSNAADLATTEGIANQTETNVIGLELVYLNVRVSSEPIGTDG